MYNEIRNIIKSKKKDIDDETLTYFTNYFYVISEKNIIPEQVELDDLIDNGLLFANKVEFYDSDHWVYKKYGGDVKGFRDPESKTIFIRDNLEQTLREITVYHELHHAVQTNIENNEVGINQKSNIGRLIMEAQTQYIAEEVYKTIYNVEFDDMKIPTENIRMQEGGVIVSKLHNYQMYDVILSKLSILLDVSKDFFVTINYLYKNNLGLNLLEKKYNDAKEKYNLDYPFGNMMLMCDYIYLVDLMVYVDTPEKDFIMNGGETKNKYKVYPNIYKTFSLEKQRKYMYEFDRANFVKLLDNDGDYVSFSNYVVDNKLRGIIGQVINLKTEENKKEKIKEKNED